MPRRWDGVVRIGWGWEEKAHNSCGEGYNSAQKMSLLPKMEYCSPPRDVSKEMDSLEETMKVKMETKMIKKPHWVGCRLGQLSNVTINIMCIYYIKTEYDLMGYSMLHKMTLTRNDMNNWSFELTMVLDTTMIYNMNTYHHLYCISMSWCCIYFNVEHCNIECLDCCWYQSMLWKTKPFDMLIMLIHVNCYY